MNPELSIQHVHQMPHENLRQFFERIDADDRAFFKENVLAPEVVAFWSREDRGLRFAASTPDGAIRGFVAVLTGTGWASRVGDLRVVVEPGFRRRGLARELARRALIAAVETGLDKVSVEVLAAQRAAVQLFQSLGLEAEALLRDHVRLRDGRVEDLMILSYFVQQKAEEMSTLGIDESLDTAVQ